MREELVIIENFINEDQLNRKSEFNDAFARIIECEENRRTNEKSSKQEV